MVGPDGAWAPTLIVPIIGGGRGCDALAGMAGRADSGQGGLKQ